MTQLGHVYKTEKDVIKNSENIGKDMRTTRARPLSSFRTVYNRMYAPGGKGMFVDFLKKTKHVFRELKRNGGDIFYVLEVLTMVLGDEISWWNYRKDMQKVPSSKVAEDCTLAMKHNGEKLIEIPLEELPKSLKKQFQKMKRHLGAKIRSSDFPGKLTTTYDLEIYHKGERYSLVYACESHCDTEPKRRGRKAEWQSNLAMYLLYRHFKQLKMRNIYTHIADMVNAYSFCNFRSGTGAPLLADHVRKRVQWVKKNGDIQKMAAQWEEAWVKNEKCFVLKRR
jgi:hypothetical protein